MIKDISIKVLRRRRNIPCEHCVNSGNYTCREGEITLGDFKERFLMSIDYWTLEDYQRQWQEGLKRIEIHVKSCLVTGVQNPKYAPLVKMWSLYKQDKVIYIRNHLFCGDIYKKYIGDKPFTPDTCYNFIPRRTKDPQISEWVVPLE